MLSPAIERSSMNELEKCSGNDIVELYSNFVMKTYPLSPDIIFSKGRGLYLWDINDRKYLDFATGISVCNLGHCHPSVTSAIRKQAGKLVHVSNLYMNEKQAELASKIISHCFDGVVFFCNSGAEANEGLIKFARKYGSVHKRHEIIVMLDSFHGRTLATLAATGRSKYREGFQPDMPGFIHVPFNDIGALEKAVTDRTCAIMIEPVQGEGGVIPAETDYLRRARSLCDEKNVFLLFDEVQCGMGRTGELFAWQSYGVEPDAFSLAKALGNGFPIGAFIVKRKHENVLGAGTHASTFGGTPLACAASCAVIDTIYKENLLENCREMSKYLFEKLIALKDRHSEIKGIRGRGLMLGIVLDKSGAKIRNLAASEGLLILTAGENVLRLLPPINLNRKHIDKAVKILDKCFEKMKG